jgi:hypothetical protein
VAGVALALPVAIPPPAHALFHLARIQELATRVGGDPEQQFVEIRMLGVLQNFVRNSVLATFDAQGNYIEDLLIVPDNVANHGAEVRWVMATAALQAAHGFSADFTIPARIPLGGGMICWGAPGLIPPDPASWERTDVTNFIDCLAYGTYDGPTNVLIGVPSPLLPEGHSLVRIDDTRNNAANFSCATTISPENNAGGALALPATEACSPPAVLIRGGGSAGTDCLLEWAILNAPAGTGSKQVCTDGDVCDRSPEPGCRLGVQICLNAGDASLEGRCAAEGAAAFVLKKPRTAGGDAATAGAMLDAVAALGGSRDGNTVTFEPPLAGTNRCSPTIDIDVPLAERGGSPRQGKLVIKAKHTGSVSGRSKRDKDRLKLFCRPAG